MEAIDHETELTQLLATDLPEWIDQDAMSTLGDLVSVQQGGCGSGAYMPAVTYWQAIQTMAEHGDEVFQYIQDALGELPTPNNDISWSGLACFYLSYAVELWASGELSGLAYTPPELTEKRAEQLQDIIREYV